MQDTGRTQRHRLAMIAPDESLVSTWQPIRFPFPSFPPFLFLVYLSFPLPTLPFTSLQLIHLLFQIQGSWNSKIPILSPFPGLFSILFHPISYLQIEGFIRMEFNKKARVLIVFAHRLCLIVQTTRCERLEKVRYAFPL